jgi:glycosyltransferase involved in cell wall biosynthesis
MKIAFITAEYPTAEKPQGGLATYLQKTARNLVKNGNEVTIFFLSSRDRLWEDDNIKIHEIENKQYGKYFFSKIPVLRILYWLIIDLIAEKKIEKKFLKINKISKFNILQVPIIPNGEALGFFLLNNKVCVPVVCRFSFYPPLYFNILNKTQIINYVKHWFTLYKIKNSVANFSPCYFMAEKIYSETKVMPDVIYSPIDDMELLIDIDCSIKPVEEYNYLIYYNQFDLFKGIDLIADIANSLLDEYKNLAFIFAGKDTGVGLKKSQYSCWKNFIKAKCDSNYHNRLIFYPPLSKEQLFPLIKNAEAVLIPSRADNYPNACLEALMVGTPVIGTYNSSLEEMIIDGKTGFLATNSDASSLKNSIERLLTLSVDERLKMKKNIIEYLEKVRSEDRTGQLVRFYEAAIKKFNTNKC